MNHAPPPWHRALTWAHRPAAQHVRCPHRLARSHGHSTHTCSERAGRTATAETGEERYFKRPLDFPPPRELVITHRIARIAAALPTARARARAGAAMATNASPPLQLATAFRPLASAAGGGGGGLLAGGGGVATGRGRGRAQRRVAARSVASDRDVQGPVSLEEGTWLRPPAGSDVSGEVWVAMRFELLLIVAIRACDPCAVRTRGAPARLLCVSQANHGELLMRVG